MDNMTSKEYQPITIPKLKWTKKILTDSFGELVAEPLETGFGFTLGNALRRTLLAAVEGSAVTSVIIKGVNNEFSLLPGVAEDAMQIILNIKGIILRNTSGEPGTMRLQVSGESVVRAGDIKTNSHLEIVNPDHIIAHVSADGTLDIDFFVESGRGYQVAQWPSGKSIDDDGKIYLDAMFSPVRKVMFDVEKTRVGKDIDYDKLILRITTDGTENPLDVLHYSVSVLRTQLKHFLDSAEIPFNDISQLPDEEKEPETQELDTTTLQGISPEVLLKPIEELELSVRAHNCLVNAGIKRFIDLVNLNEEEGLKIKNFGRKSLNEVKDSMKAFGLSFGMDIKESDLRKALKDNL
jgi:DNA-directed RNA polymerase subunit alpha